MYKRTQEIASSTINKLAVLSINSVESEDE